MAINSLLAEKLKAPANAVAGSLSADVLLFNADTTRQTVAALSTLIKSRKRRDAVLLVLTTYGGDPHAAYRISRALQQSYKKFICMVDGYCKSAGTIIVIGAQSLILSEYGEIGPIDVQLSKKDELEDYQSGLTVLTSLTALQEKAYLNLEYFIQQIEQSSDGRIKWRTAAEIAARITGSLYGPIYRQIDPLQVGEAVRAMSIASEYAKRLLKAGRNLKGAVALDQLVSKYPDHGFVIDWAEIETMFLNVRKPSEAETDLINAMGSVCKIPHEDTATIAFLDDELKEGTDDEAPNGDTNKADRTGPDAPTPAANDA